MNFLKLFRSIAILEGVSYLLLGFTMILKYGYAIKQPNYIVGMAHGLLFISYFFLLIKVAIDKKLNFQQIILAFIASLIPFGTFYADKNWFSKW